MDPEEISWMAMLQTKLTRQDVKSFNSALDERIPSRTREAIKCSRMNKEYHSLVASYLSSMEKGNDKFVPVRKEISPNVTTEYIHPNRVETVCSHTKNQ